MTRSARRRQKGVAFLEFALIVPFLAYLMLAGIDVGRLLTLRQQMTDLSREAANLVSRGSSADDAFATTQHAGGPFAQAAQGKIIVSRISRRSANDATPIVAEQETSGTLPSASSRVGTTGGPATLPGVTALDPGVMLTSVELIHSFQPLFPLTPVGRVVFPSQVYDVAVF
jgi:Flp pilus assembly protein TadG